LKEIVVKVNQIIITGLEGIPTVKNGDDIADIIIKAASKQGAVLADGDIIAITSKIVSKAEGRIVHLEDVEPSVSALKFSKVLGSDPRKVEVILSEAKRIVRMVKGLVIVETRQGFVCANGGIDASNIEPGTLVLLPKNSDKSARRIKQTLKSKANVDVAVIITDTFGRPWREGQINIAIGVAGIIPLFSYVGSNDTYGNALSATNMAVADEIASASELVMGKLNKIPVVVVRGYKYEAGKGSARKLVRKVSRDLFR
jgi:coenzyme F420-0:L-glutamate ligase/coenzyme F420-1:gamma-L-glutamate ligase|tara:strand:+ start:569 stop:1339 length:771 start_codon:yes stop_codon:yes gene_type:complete